jgi:hypothetical protein
MPRQAPSLKKKASRHIEMMVVVEREVIVRMSRQTPSLKKRKRHIEKITRFWQSKKKTFLFGDHKQVLN